jgi:hypothetical protein
METNNKINRLKAIQSVCWKAGKFGIGVAVFAFLVAEAAAFRTDQINRKNTKN